MRTHVIRWLVLFVLAMATGMQVSAAASPPLPPHQSEWLGRHPTIILGMYDSGWPPFESMQNGKPVGLGYDYLSLLTRQLGVQVQVRMYRDWTEVLEAACRGEVDVVMNITLTADRTRCMVYTRPYARAPLALVGRPGETRASSDPDLRGLRVVTEREFVTSDEVRSRFPGARRVTAASTTAALAMVGSGEADVYIGNAYVATTLIAERRLTDVSLLRPSDLPPERLHFGVPNAKQPLAEALDMGLAALNEAERERLERRWLPTPRWSVQSQVILGNAERRVLATPLRLAFAPNAAPLAFIDSADRPSGVSAEYLRLLRTVGAQLTRVPAHDWFDVREQLRRGEVDAIMGIPNDSNYLGDGWVFSQPFITVPNVVVTASGSASVLGVPDLDGRSILLSDPERLRGYVLQQAPNARIVPARSAELALSRLAKGDADAYIGNLAVIDRIVRDHYPAQLHVAAPAGFSDRLSLAVKRQYAPLATTFDRLLVNMSAREHEAIRSDWLSAEYRSDLDWRATARWAVPLALVLLTALLVHGWGHWRLRSEVAMRRRAEQRLADVTDNLPAIVYQGRRERDGRLSLPYIAGDTEALFGLTAAEAMADESALIARIDERDRANVRQALESATRDFAPVDMEFRTRPGGMLRWVRSRALPYDAEDGVLLWSGYWIDVTEARAQADALALAKAAAERATAAKSEFLATMSHEIRTPMSGVLGMVEVLSHTSLDGEQRRIISVIEDSAQMLRQILDDLLDYSKIEAGALSLQPHPVALRALVGNVQQLLAPQAVAKGLELQIQIDDALAAMHLVDGMRLRQIAFNLLSNAIKFTRAGEVGIALEVLDGDADGAQQLRLTVRDTGIGISPEQRERLFAPFVQADAATSRQYGGTGLGLSICQRLVAMMHGTLTLHSVPGEGTRVEVLLTVPVVPVDEQPSAAEEHTQAVPLPAALQQRRILIVEDHPTNQALMGWRMQQLGLPHVLAENGEQALALLARTRFDLVLTDCRMPVMDGYAMTRRIREQERDRGGARLPVIALTASAMEGDLQRCREAGMDDLLAKPVALGALRQALLQWLPDGDGPLAGAEQAPGADDAPPDRAALVRRFGSEHVAGVLIESLCTASAEDLVKLQAALDAQAGPALVNVLHRLVGGLATLGADALALQARSLMERVDDEGVAAHAEAVSAFDAALRAYLVQLQAS
ncbi:transporter substrate-binding domain-containing protein [Stenotrophomonas rhizophila]|jgi:two-component system sensor histidine kinase EvgS|uniref:ATP-binding protein n=1 Tax=Stenotrophomonas rhizophila TaxID=216778 RepID=UPI00224B17E5|nr:transporter substrate-binding domain-containing protein [Stenotrophomonas rhizophila]MCX2920337.1 transporter substrate-binding domain-containing protein [Stenotrophomonas rhizophila]